MNSKTSERSRWCCKRTLFFKFTFLSFPSFFDKRAGPSKSFPVLSVEYRISMRNKVERFGLRGTRRTKKKAKPRSRSILQRGSSFENAYFTREDIFNEETNDRHPAIIPNKCASRVLRFNLGRVSPRVSRYTYLRVKEDLLNRNFQWPIATEIPMLIVHAPWHDFFFFLLGGPTYAYRQLERQTDKFIPSYRGSRDRSRGCCRGRSRGRNRDLGEIREEIQV